MAARTVQYVLIKLVRLTGWALLVVAALYVLSGYAACGRFGLGAVWGPRRAMAWHKAMDVPFIVLFLAHALPAGYLALRRWGWIGRKSRP